MKWVLLLIAFYNGEWISTPYGEFANEEDCNWARDYTVELLDPDLTNYQAVCVKVKNDNTSS